VDVKTWQLVALAALVTACSSPGSTCPNDLPSPSQCSAGIPSWGTDVQSIMVAKCAPCHRPGNLNAPLLDSWAAVADAGSPVLDQTYRCAMPPPDAGSAYVLAPQERHDLLLWLVCGAPNN
jgi:hypothetical protein